MRIVAPDARCVDDALRIAAEACRFLCRAARAPLGRGEAIHAQICFGELNFLEASELAHAGFIPAARVQRVLVDELAPCSHLFHVKCDAESQMYASLFEHVLICFFSHAKSV